MVFVQVVMVSWKDTSQVRRSCLGPGRIPRVIRTSERQESFGAWLRWNVPYTLLSAQDHFACAARSSSRRGMGTGRIPVLKGLRIPGATGARPGDPRLGGHPALRGDPVPDRSTRGPGARWFGVVTVQAAARQDQSSLLRLVGAGNTTSGTAGDLCPPPPRQPWSPAFGTCCGQRLVALAWSMCCAESERRPPREQPSVLHEEHRPAAPPPRSCRAGVNR